jgi:hypothetical protein
MLTQTVILVTIGGLPLRHPQCAGGVYLLLQNEFAVRGAIALGSFSRSDDPNGTFVAGRAIIEAYNYEKIQDWIGIILSPTVLQKYGNLQNIC